MRRTLTGCSCTCTGAIIQRIEAGEQATAMARLEGHERTRKSWGNAPMINCGGKYFRFVFVVDVDRTATVSNSNRKDFDFLFFSLSLPFDQTSICLRDKETRRSNNLEGINLGILFRIFLFVSILRFLFKRVWLNR